MSDDLEQRYLDRMVEIAKKRDTETAHSEADDLLIELLRDLGYERLAKVFDEMDKWYA